MNKISGRINTRVILLTLVGLFFIVYEIKSKVFDSWDTFLFHIGDMAYCYNRTIQLGNCIRDGIFPFFGYSDFYNLGYGSNFFYGWVTLLPFVSIAEYSYQAFVALYYTVMVVLTLFGVWFFAKRFTSNAYEIALLYISGFFFCHTILVVELIPSYVGVAISFIFIAKCIDFFRDSKSFIPSSVLFLVLLNTHLISSVFAFISCVFVMIAYFDKRRLYNYFCFALTTFMMCIWNISQVMYYIDIFTSNGGSINKQLIANINQDNSFMRLTVLSDYFICGSLAFLFNIVPLDSINSIVMMNMSTFGICSICLIRNRKLISKRSKMVLILIGVVTVFGIKDIFLFVASHINLFFQTWIRFGHYVLCLFLIISLRHLNKKWLFGVLFAINLVDMFIWFNSPYKVENTEDAYFEELDCYLDKSYLNEARFFFYCGNGEYMPVNASNDNSSYMFEFDNYFYNVIGNDEKVYDYYYDKDLTVCDLSESTSSYISVPKLFYKGYKAWGSDGREFDVSESDKGYALISIGNYKGIVTVRYVYPFILLVSFFISLLSIVWFCFLRNIFKKCLTL